jgi:hypothetical protein
MVIKTEKDVVDSFVRFRSEYVSKQENETYLDSLDCALATLIYCEKYDIPYSRCWEIIKAAIKEPGELWDACVKEAWRKAGSPQEPTLAQNIAIEAIAIKIGSDWLIQGFEDGL